VASHTIKTRLPVELIWEQWTSVSTWHLWDDAIEYASLKNPAFAPGSRGKIKPRGAISIDFVITHVNSEKSFTDETRLPLGVRLVFIHSLERINHKTHITHCVEMKGAFAFLLALWWGNEIRQALPKTMENLIKRARMASIEKAEQENQQRLYNEKVKKLGAAAGR